MYPILVLGFDSAIERNGVKKVSWARLFFIFCQIFGILGGFSKWGAPITKGIAKYWKIDKYAKSLAKNEKKPCSTCLP